MGESHPRELQLEELRSVIGTLTPLQNQAFQQIVGQLTNHNRQLVETVKQTQAAFQARDEQYANELRAAQAQFAQRREEIARVEVPTPPQPDPMVAQRLSTLEVAVGEIREYITRGVGNHAQLHSQPSYPPLAAAALPGMGSVAPAPSFYNPSAPTPRLPWWSR